jgi:dihydroorotase
MSENGARFYGLPLNEDLITLERFDWTVPEVYGCNATLPKEPEIPLVPFWAGKKLGWGIK